MITPQQALAFTQQDEAEAAKAEADIDECLRSYDGPATCFVECSRRAAALLKDRYEAAGWIVDMQESRDQRAPGWMLRFIIPSPSCTDPLR